LNLLNECSSVILREGKVIAWHKTPTTPDIQVGVELAIKAVVEQAGLAEGQIDSVKIGTTVRRLLSFQPSDSSSTENHLRT
jgi:hypothetical protein